MVSGSTSGSYELRSRTVEKFPLSQLRARRLAEWRKRSRVSISLRDPFQIFTNSDKAHVARVLSRLGLEDCFEGVICFETLNPPPLQYDGITEGNEATDTSNLKTQILCKPNVEAIEAAIRIASINPKKTIFFDDSTRNIASGKAAGLHTVIVGSLVLVPGADYALNSIHNIKKALPEIWEDKGGEQVEQVLQSPAVEAIVLA
ncbi:hypothetical protein Ancab_033164 [Ancistrocladus abbreviatus]